jgi:hypothetical protein
MLGEGSEHRPGSKDLARWLEPARTARTPLGNASRALSEGPARGQRSRRGSAPVVSAILLGLGAALSVVGVAITFAGDRPRPRVLGLAAMGAGAVLVLIATGPASTTTWAMAMTSGATLAGLIWYAVVLARWADQGGDRPTRLDDEST